MVTVDQCVWNTALADIVRKEMSPLLFCEIAIKVKNEKSSSMRDV